MKFVSQLYFTISEQSMQIEFNVLYLYNMQKAAGGLHQTGQTAPYKN